MMLPGDLSHNERQQAVLVCSFAQLKQSNHKLFKRPAKEKPEPPLNIKLRKSEHGN
jgi:hypothetical protein